jgi:glycine rich protein
MTVTTFNYTGAPQTYTVPTGVTSVVIDAVGSSGCPWSSNNGGTGAHVRGTLAVTPGDVLQINVGGGGLGGNGITGTGSTAGAGGWNGGGNGGLTSAAGYSAGNGGGGASDVRHGGTALANRVIVAAGGGSAGASGNGGGGGSLGGNGAAGVGGDSGGGGTQTAGGAGTGSIPGAAGALGIGGAGAGTNTVQHGGSGAGSGYYGGAGGGFDSGTGANAGAGGGGSSYAGGCTSTSTIAAGVTGGNSAIANNDGYVTITTTDTAPNAPTLTLPINAGFADVTNTVLGWTFSDPDTGDTQSSADLRYRVAGTTVWTTLAGIVTGQTSTYQLSGLTVGVQYEWQVRTYDSQAVVGAWSSSFFFTVKSHPAVVITQPVPGQIITSLSTQIIFTLGPDQNGVTFRRVGDINGQPDPTNIIETANLGSSSLNSHTFSATTHNDGPEHWQVQVNTFNSQLASGYIDVPVVMAIDFPATPTVVATPIIASAAIQVVATFEEMVVDYFPLGSVPTTAQTGQSLTTVGSGIGGGGFLTVANGNVSQTAVLNGKVLSMQCSFRQNNLGSSTHTNSVYLVATDASNNAHIYCGIDAQHWYIKLDTAGTLSTIASGTLATPITTGAANATPWTMSATVLGTTVTFTDPSGTIHTATNASFGSFTGTHAQLQINNSANNSTDDTWKVSHWSADSTASNIAVTGYIARSTDGVNFTEIPSAVWDTAEYGAQKTFIDYTAPFNRQVWYQAVAVTALGAQARSVVS